MTVQLRIRSTGAIVGTSSPIQEIISSKDLLSRYPLYHVTSVYDYCRVNTSNFKDSADRARTLEHWKWYPIPLVVNERAYSVDNVTGSINPILVRDSDGNIIHEPILAKDKLPLIGVTPFIATPQSHASDPWFFLQLSFTTHPQYNFYMTYGEDVVLKKSDNTLILFQNRLLSEPTISKELGEELYGSIVFPSTNIIVDNSDNAFQFIINDPKISYGGFLQVWRWDPISATLIEEYSGITTGINVQSMSISFDFAVIGREFFDKMIPKNEQPSSEIFGSSTDAPILGRHFGRNLNVRCPLIKASGEGEPQDYWYFAGWGQNKVTRVFVGGRSIPLYPDEVSDPAYGYQIEYGYDTQAIDPAVLYTKIVFKEAQTDFDGNWYPVTANIEGIRLRRRNKLRWSEEFEKAPSPWSAANVYKKDKYFYGPDSSKTASCISGVPSLTPEIKQTIVDGTTWSNGCIGYVIVKKPSVDDMAFIINQLKIPALTPLDVTTNVKIGPVISGSDKTNDVNLLKGNISLGDGWYLIWMKWPYSLSSAALDFRISMATASTFLIAGSYFAESIGGANPGGVPDELENHPYESTYASKEVSTRNFALNVYEILTSSMYGFFQYSVDVDSFEKAGWKQFINNLYCDGAMTVNEQGQAILNDLLTAYNCRLERKGPFRTWYMYADTDTKTSVANFGIGDSLALNNLSSDVQFQIQPAENFPKGVFFESGPIRDLDGSLIKYRRISKRLNNEIDYGRIISLTNRYIRYERTADFLCDRIYDKLQKNVTTYSFQTTEFSAWNLELDDVVTLYVPHQGLNGKEVEIISIVKSFSSVQITARSFNPSYSYGGIYPKDKDGDKIEVEVVPGDPGQSRSGSSIPTLSEPGGLPARPVTGFAKIVLRRTGGAAGQELIAYFEDGSQRLIARSDTGSPGYVQGIRIVEPVASTDWYVSSGYTLPSEAEVSKIIYLKKAAICNALTKPKVTINGVEQHVNLVLSSANYDFLAWNTTPIGEVNYHTFQNLVELQSTYTTLNSTVQIEYDAPIDFSAHIFVSTNLEAQRYRQMYVLKNTGNFLRGIRDDSTAQLLYLSKYTYYSEVRSFEGGAEPYFYVMNRYTNAYQGIYPRMEVRRYSAYGYSPPADVYDLFETGVEYGAFATSGSPGNHILLVDVAGVPYTVLSKNGKTYLIRGTNIGIAEVDDEGNYLRGTTSTVYNFTAICQGATVTSAAWDTVRNEIHLALSNQYIKIIDADTMTYSGIQYQNVTGYIVGLQYDPIDDLMYATLNSNTTGTGTHYGVFICNTSGGDQTGALTFGDANLLIKDIYKHTDGYCYVLYAHASTKALGVAVINWAVLKTSGFSSYLLLNQNIATLDNATTDRAFLSVLSAKLPSLTQVV